MKSKQFFAGILISSFLLTAASGCMEKSKPITDIATIEQKSSGTAIYELASGNSSKTDEEERKRAYSEFSVTVQKMPGAKTSWSLPTPCFSRWR